MKIKSVLKGVGILVGAVGLVAGGLCAFVAVAGIPKYPAPPPLDLHIEVTPARVQAGKKIASMVCAECHFDQATQRLSGKVVDAFPAMFGVARSRNITRDPVTGIGAWTDGQLVTLLRTTLKPDGTPNAMMPPVGFHLADEDLASVIAFLRSDDPWVAATTAEDPDSSPSLVWKALWRFRIGSFKPIPMPTEKILVPDPSDKVAFGRYLALGRAECYGCHSPDITKVNFSDPEKTVGHLGGGFELQDATGRSVPSANITADATGIGGWSEAEFVRALKTGFRADHTPIRYPMPRFNEFTDEELGAIYAYLRQVPKVARARPAAATAAVATADSASPGKKLYYQYQCQTCHGDLGKGACDLRGAHEKYKTDADLIAWIRDPSKKIPETKMPTWDGVIAEADYAPLCEHVRSLGQAGVASR